MALVRYKYRPSPVQPEFGEGLENRALTKHKKVKPEEVDPYANIRKVTHEPTIFLATHTQCKRQEIVVKSDEEAIRRKQYPTIEEKIAQQKEWARIQLKEAKMASEREAIQKIMERKIRAEIQGMTGNESNIANVGGDAADKEIAAVAMIPEDPESKGPTGGFDENDLINIEENLSDDIAQELLDIKEKKVLATRNSKPYHRPIGKWKARRLALQIQLGLLSRRSRDVTEILPWLVIGRRETVTSLQSLLRLGFTHILNITAEVPNSFPQHFVYKKIPLRDSMNANIASHFATIIEFIKRVEDCKGRLLVHCSIGSSRAPTAVIAFLVIAKRIPLVDAFNYVLALRPLIMPNQHFLYELAMLETQLGEGCSVYYHRDWRFYEFNLFRAEQVPPRPTLGSYATTMKLLLPNPETDDSYNL